MACLYFPAECSWFANVGNLPAESEGGGRLLALLLPRSPHHRLPHPAAVATEQNPRTPIRALNVLLAHEFNLNFASMVTVSLLSEQTPHL